MTPKPITVRSDASPNTLLYADNLPIRREYVPDASRWTLIYLDPPFNSSRSYNVLVPGRKRSMDSESRRSRRLTTPGIGDEARRAYLPRDACERRRRARGHDDRCASREVHRRRTRLMAYLVMMAARRWSSPRVEADREPVSAL